MEMINLKSDDYYSQRNNKLNPTKACMPTSYVMFLKANKIPFKNYSTYQDDDYFMSLLNTDDAKKYAYKNYPWAYNDIFPEQSLPPNEIHGMYPNYLAPMVCGKKVSTFQTNLTLEKFKEEIKKGRAIMTSIYIPDMRINGHAIVIMGIRGDNLLIADPWGNLNTSYKSVKGYAVEISENQFRELVKPIRVEEKWGHIIL